MTRTHLAVTALLWAACSLQAADARGVTLAVRGKPATVTVVIPAQPSPSQKHAAEELCATLERQTGVRLPLTDDRGPLPAQAVLIGETRHTSALLGPYAPVATLGEDGFRLVTRPPHVLILGGPARGSLYGVYETLERFGGCRWYASWHSLTPPLDAFSIPELDETQQPAFAMREPFWFDFFDGDLAARNKCNGNAMRLSERHGGKVRFGGGLFVHTFNILCPPEEFFASHPEYFSEVSGRRIKDHTQLCLTHPDVLRIVTERLLARIRKDPTAKLFSVSQNDWQNPCACPACKALDDREGSHAGTLIAFVNQVAEAVEKEFPDVWIETLAYQYTRKPPKTLRPRANVVPRLCTIECDFAAPLALSAFQQNRTFVEELRAWSTLTDKLYIWDYTTNFRAYVAPFPNVRALQDNVRLFRDRRVVGLFEQGAYQGRHADFAELKAWLLAKWLWDPDRPAAPLLDDFFSGYYGAAAPLARQIFDGYHSFHTDTAEHPLRIFDTAEKSDIPDSFLAQADGHWRRAEAAVADAPAFLYNVRMAALPTLFARFERLPSGGTPDVWCTSEPQRYAVPAEQQALAADLLARLEEARNVRISESEERHGQTLARLRSLAQPPPLPPPQSRVTVEDRTLALGRRGVWGDTVADPLAEDGSALKLYNTHFEWCATLPFSRVAFDPGATYRLRARIRVDRVPGQDGQAFWSGVYDAQGRASRGEISRSAAALGDGYAWFDIATWVPAREHYFWIGPGRFDKQAGANAAHRAVYVDKLELSRQE